MGVIIFNGISSEDLHVVVQHPPEYAYPDKDYDVTHVPGRNGDVVIDKGSWQNVERVYDLGIDAREYGYTEVAGGVAQWLHSASGYVRLEDTYEPDYFRLAMYKDKGSISNIYNKAGTIEVTFDCKPQRYLKSGEDPISLMSGGSVYNPTGFVALPTIEVFGSGAGTIYINNQAFLISNIPSCIVIDSETQDAYNGPQNLNANINMDTFPFFKPGENQIYFTGGISCLEITPRWWTL